MVKKNKTIPTLEKCNLKQAFEYFAFGYKPVEFVYEKVLNRKKKYYEKDIPQIVNVKALIKKLLIDGEISACGVKGEIIRYEDKKFPEESYIRVYPEQSAVNIQENILYPQNKFDNEDETIELSASASPEDDWDNLEDWGSQSEEDKEECKAAIVERLNNEPEYIPMLYEDYFDGEKNWSIDEFYSTHLTNTKTNKGNIIIKEKIPVDILRDFDYIYSQDLILKNAKVAEYGDGKAVLFRNRGYALVELDFAELELINSSIADIEEKLIEAIVQKCLNKKKKDQIISDLAHKYKEEGKSRYSAAAEIEIILKKNNVNFPKIRAIQNKINHIIPSQPK